jgi:hypothetical protein
MAKRILSEIASKRSKRIQEFRLETTSESPAALRAEILVHLQHLRQLDRIGEALKGVRYE